MRIYDNTALIIRVIRTILMVNNSDGDKTRMIMALGFGFPDFHARFAKRRVRGFGASRIPAYRPLLAYVTPKL